MNLDDCHVDTIYKHIVKIKTWSFLIFSILLTLCMVAVVSRPSQLAQITRLGTTWIRCQTITGHWCTNFPTPSHRQSAYVPIFGLCSETGVPHRAQGERANSTNADRRHVNQKRFHLKANNFSLKLIQEKTATLNVEYHKNIKL